MPLPFSGVTAEPFGTIDDASPRAERGLASVLEGFTARLKDGWQLLRPARQAIPEHDLILCVALHGWELLAKTKDNTLSAAENRQAFVTRDALIEALKQPHGHRGRALRLLVLVPEDAVLEERLTLPALPEADLNRQFSAAIDRLSPFPAESTVSIIARDGAFKDCFRFMLAVFDRQLIDALLEIPQETGVIFAGLGVAGEMQIRFASPFPAARGQSLLQRWSVLPGLLSFNTTRADALRSGASEASERLAKRTQRAELEQAAAAQKTSSRMLIKALEQLSAELPDTAWLEMFRVEEGMVSLTFYASSANETRSLVQSLPGFSNVAIDGTITRDADVKIERFVISGRFDAAQQVAKP
jgi:Fimbrial assembly protein (PilN)